MKKTYTEPTLEVVKIETTQMMLTVSGFNSTLEGNPCDAGDALAPDLESLTPEEILGTGW